MFLRLLPFVLQAISVLIAFYAFRLHLVAIKVFDQKDFLKAHQRLSWSVVMWAISGSFAQAAIIVLFMQIPSSD